MESQAEWTFEGGPEMERVGAAGNRTRYQFGMYLKYMIKWTQCQFEWYRDNKEAYYRLRNYLEAVF